MKFSQETKTRLRQIQANTLSYHGRDHAWCLLVTFQFVDDKKDGPRLRTQLGEWFSGSEEFGHLHLTSLLEQKEGSHGKNRCDFCEDDQSAIINFGLSAKGYKRLGLTSFFEAVPRTELPEFKAWKAKAKEEQIPTDFHFWKGMLSRDLNAFLLDEKRSIKKRDQGYDAIFWIAASTQSRIKAEIRKIKSFFKQSKCNIESKIERGRHLWRKNPVSGKKEHYEPFGYRDGMSKLRLWQTNESGAMEPDPDNQSIVLDYQDGTYLVFRKLEQNIAAFHRLMDRCAEEALLKSGEVQLPVHEMELKRKEYKELAMAKMVGRYQDGRPLIHPSSKGDITSRFSHYDVRDYMNGFEQDPAGELCPFNAHIRRVNPRNNFLWRDPEQGYDPFPNQEGKKLQVRIARRSIPYDERQSREKGSAYPTKGVGLLFLSVQASITNQFEVIAGSWMARGRNDDLKATQADFLSTSRALQKAGHEPLVTLLDGEYFYLPPIPWLKNLGNLAE